MMPVLIAEEALNETERIAVGITGWGYRQEVAKELKHAWRRDTEIGHVKKRRPKPATPEVLGGMGIGYHVITKQTDG